MDLEIEKQEDLTVFWDFSSTQNSSAAATISTSALVKNICTAVSPYGPLKSIRLYWDHAGYPIQPTATRIRSELSASGVCIIDCPSEGRNGGAMKKLLVDLIIHAWDHEAGPHTYVVITTDRDVAYALSRLRMKEYRIILLSPAVTHSDLASQATIHLDWTKSILGLQGPYTSFGDLPPTASPHSSAAESHQPGSSRLREGTLRGIYQEASEHSLPNSDEPPPGHQSSSPSLPNATRIYDIGGPGPAFPQTPPRASTWSMPSDSHVASTIVPNPASSNSMPSGGPAVGFNRLSRVSFEKPLNISRDNPRPTEITFDPFNDPDDLPRSPFTGIRNSRTRMESVTPSSESTCSYETRSSPVNPHPVSTAPTSAEEERKPADLKPQSIASDAVELVNGKTSGNVAIPSSEAIVVIEGVQSEPRPIEALPASLLTTTQTSTVTATTIPSIPVPQPFANAPVVSPSVTQMWNPLIDTLRQNGGTVSYLALPPKLLKSYPRAYGLAGRSKYKQYIQLAAESGIIVERIEGDPNCPSIQLTATYI